LINKNIIALGFVSFFTDMASAMVTSILPIFIVYILNEGVDKLGFVVAIATLISYGFRILFGYMSDKFQIVKPFVVSGYLISAVTKPMLALSNSWQSVALLRGLERMGKAIRSATKDSLISAYSDKRSGRSFGFHKMMDVAGEMSGALIAFFILYFLGKSEEVFRELFAWTFLPGILAVITVIFFVKDAPYRAKEQRGVISLRDDKPLALILILYFIFIFFLFSDSFFIIKAKEMGIKIEFIPLIMAFYNLIQTLFSYLFGVQIDRYSPRLILGVAMGFGVGAMGMLLLNQVVLSFILLALFSVASLNSIRALISNEAKNRGTIYGLFYAGVALFGSIGAMVIGIIWKNYGQESAVVFSLAGLSLTLLIYLIAYLKMRIRA